MTDRPLLNNPKEYPNDNVLLCHLGKRKAVWDDFVHEISTTFPSMTLEWRFYNDGKAWLSKLVCKKKTMCWISVWDKYFKTTFYFMDRHAKDIRALKIDKSLKTKFLSEKSIGKLRPLSVEVKTRKALSDVFRLIIYKSGSQ